MRLAFCIFGFEIAALVLSPPDEGEWVGDMTALPVGFAPTPDSPVREPGRDHEP